MRYFLKLTPYVPNIEAELSYGVAGKLIVDTKKEIAQFGLGDKPIGGTEADRQVNWSKIKEFF